MKMAEHVSVYLTPSRMEFLMYLCGKYMALFSVGLSATLIDTVYKIN
jgi:hypothetical protein